MRGFNPEFGINELALNIENGYFDSDIKEYLVELMSDSTDNITRDNCAQYFDVTCEDDAEGYIYLYPGATIRELSSMPRKYKDLLFMFTTRIISIYDEIVNRKDIKELIVEVQEYLRKIKVNNNLNFKDFEKVVVTACNNVSREFKEIDY